MCPSATYAATAILPTSTSSSGRATRTDTGSGIGRLGIVAYGGDLTGRFCPLAQQYPKPILVQYEYAERDRLVVLGPRRITNHHERGLLGPRTDRLAAACGDLLF